MTGTVSGKTAHRSVCLVWELRNAQRVRPPTGGGRALRRFQRRVEDALEAVGGDRDAARKVRDAVADATRGQGQSGVTSAIQVEQRPCQCTLDVLRFAGGQGRTSPEVI
jgi:hypothetical protein